MLLQLLDSVKIILPETNNNNRIISEIMYWRFWKVLRKVSSPYQFMSTSQKQYVKHWPTMKKWNLTKINLVLDKCTATVKNVDLNMKFKISKNLVLPVFY